MIKGGWKFVIPFSDFEGVANRALRWTDRLTYIRISIYLPQTRGKIIKYAEGNNERKFWGASIIIEKPYDFMMKLTLFSNIKALRVAHISQREYFVHILIIDYFERQTGI